MRLALLLLLLTSCASATKNRAGDTPPSSSARASVPITPDKLARDIKEAFAEYTKAFPMPTTAQDTDLLATATKQVNSMSEAEIADRLADQGAQDAAEVALPVRGNSLRATHVGVGVLLGTLLIAPAAWAYYKRQLTNLRSEEDKFKKALEGSTYTLSNGATISAQEHYDLFRMFSKESDLNSFAATMRKNIATEEESIGIITTNRTVDLLPTLPMRRAKLEGLKRNYEVLERYRSEALEAKGAALDEYFNKVYQSDMALDFKEYTKFRDSAHQEAARLSNSQLRVGMMTSVAFVTSVATIALDQAINGRAFALAKQPALSPREKLLLALALIDQQWRQMPRHRG